MDQFAGGNWPMLPNMQVQGTFSTPTNQDHLFLQQQQQFQYQQQQQQQQQFQPQDQQFQQFHHQQQQQQPQYSQQQQFHQQQQIQPQHQQPQQQQLLLHSPPQQQRMLQSPPQQQQSQQHHQSLASHFHLYPLVEKLADAIENGTRDQHSDALVSELNNHFERCQQLLNSISGSLSSKNMTVEGQKRKLEETEQLLNQRRDVTASYQKSIEELVKSEP